MVLAFRSSDAQAVRQQRTTTSRPGGARAKRSVFRTARCYVLPAAIAGAGILVIELSAGVGWALILLGASFAAAARPAPRWCGTRRPSSVAPRRSRGRA
jgi:hypothetical protein